MTAGIHITLNGESTEIPSEMTVAQLLAHLDLEDRPVAVEVNREIVPKRDHDSHLINPEDHIEFVTLVGGG